MPAPKRRRTASKARSIKSVAGGGKGYAVASTSNRKSLPQKTRLTKRANDFRTAVSANGGQTNRGVTKKAASLTTSTRKSVPQKTSMTKRSNDFRKAFAANGNRGGKPRAR